MLAIDDAEVVGYGMAICGGAGSLKYFHDHSIGAHAAVATTTHRCSQWRNFGACVASLKSAAL
jgi:hypothetical protein